MEGHTSDLRKQAHIELTGRSQVFGSENYRDLSYEPMLASHPSFESYPETLGLSFFGKNLKAPLWVSSMTGGTEVAFEINHRLARACKKYGLGMGLGSCRSILESDNRLSDFDVRESLGDEVPLFANIGIAQLEELVDDSKLHLLENLVSKLRADGLMIHINPLQEWCQPEGDRYKKAPIETLEAFFKSSPQYCVMVKEVGQGFGPKSLQRLFSLPIDGLEFGALGGTNFTLLELLRAENGENSLKNEFAYVGHTACQMVNDINSLLKELPLKDEFRFVISGGVRKPVEGFKLLSQMQGKSVLGMGKPFLDAALLGEEALESFICEFIESLQMAQTFLRFNE